MAEAKDLKKLLDLLDLSQAWAARQVGVSAPYLGNIILGRIEPSEGLKNRIKALRDRLRILSAA